MERIVKKLSRWQPEIAQLYQESEEFQESCHDYEEVCSLLAALTAPADANSATIDGYRTLLTAREAEILDALHARFQHVRLPEQETTPQGTSFIEDDEEDKPATQT